MPKHITLLTKLSIRNDQAGSGFYGASRGGRRHNGIDFAAQPGSILLSPIAGVITRLGWPYSGDTLYRYIQVTARDCPHPKYGPRVTYSPSNLGKCHKCGIDHLAHRFFYVRPLVESGQSIEVGDALGVVQDVTKKYNSPDMLPHVHYEVKQLDQYLDPEKVAMIC